MDKKIFIFIVIILVLLGIVAAVEQTAPKAQTVENLQMPLSAPQTYATTTITMPKGAIVAQIADTIVKETQGLSGRASLPQGTGMLFVFDSTGPQYMWMKDMNFPLDMVWLDQNKNVTYVAVDVTPQSYEQNPPEVFSSPTPASYVIELPANDASRLGIVLGVKLNF